jgi:RimJ/RimL family protein N-acetyltransferase
MTRGRAHLGATAFVALVSPGNHASRRVLEKAGLRFLRGFAIEQSPHDLFRSADAGKASGP